MYLRQSTAQTIRFGPFLDATDGVTEEAALTIAQADRQISKDGAAYAQSSTIGSSAHDSQGNYSTTLSATDTDTIGEMKLYVSVAGALPVWEKWFVLEESIYDGLFAAGSTYTTQTGDSFARLGVPAGASVSADVLTAQNDLDIITGADGALFDATAQTSLVDDVWDEVLTGATHNINNSAGRRLRRLSSLILEDGTAQAGTVNTITLAAAESAVDDIFRGDRVVITEGTGVGEHGIAIAYNGTTKVLTMSQNWVVTPDATSEYQLQPADVDVETWQHIPVTGDGDWAALIADTDELQADWANGGRLDNLLDAIPTTAMRGTDGVDTATMRGTDNAALASIATESRLSELDAANLPATTDSILADTADIQPNYATSASIAALNDIAVADVLTTQMTESYAADGAAPTLAQAIMLIQQSLGDFAISGTTITVRQVDGATTAATFTLDDATNPTSSTRAT